MRRHQATSQSEPGQTGGTVAVRLAVLVLVLAGSVLAALTSSLALLILARVLQGASFALYPVSVAILRDEVAPERLVRSMALLSAMLGLGGGLGLVVTGLLMSEAADYHRVFWLTTAFAAVITVAAAVVVPHRDPASSGTVDWAGAAGLAAGLSALLLARTIGLAVIGLVVLKIWWRWAQRCPQPLVSTEMLSRRPILLTNVATVLVGMGLYFVFLGLTDWVETPTASGYGFGASVLDASLVFLLPGAIAASLTAVISGRYIEKFGARVVGMTGGMAGVLGFLLLATLHTSKWEVIVAYLLANAYISLAYGALPVLVVGEVEAHQTAVATSMNAIARTVGSAIGAAVVGVILSPASNSGYIAEHDYIVLFTLGAISAVGAVLFLRATAPPRPAPLPV